MSSTKTNTLDEAHAPIAEPNVATCFTTPPTLRLRSTNHANHPAKHNTIIGEAHALIAVLELRPESKSGRCAWCIKAV
jgi:hypothetical protein